MSRPDSTALALVVACLVTPASAHAGDLFWQARGPAVDWPRGTGFGLVADPHAAQTYLFRGESFGGDLTFGVWDGTQGTWQDVTPSPGAAWPASRDSMLALDPDRRVILMFGGFLVRAAGLVYEQAIDELWEWSIEGQTWLQRQPAAGSTAPALGSAAAAYDAGRGVLVVFGGAGILGDLPTADVWEWETSSGVWSRHRAPSPATQWPPARNGSQLVYDSVRGLVVLINQYQGSGDAIAWEWDGQSWTRYAAPSPLPDTSASGPWSGSPFATTFDSARGRVVALCLPDLSLPPQLLEWHPEEGRWRLSVEPPFPTESTRETPGLIAYDAARDRLVTFGGAWGNATSNELVELDLAAQQWIDRTPTWPVNHDGGAMVYDRLHDCLLSFGGRRATDSARTADTLEWFGVAGTWRDRTPSAPGRDWPIARDHPALAYDTVAGRPLLFGGGNDNGVMNDLWEWDSDGGHWIETQRADATTPWPGLRSGHAIAWDDAHEVLVLFGGADDSGAAYGDTWIWDPRGGAWSDRSPASSPAARTGHSMYYDADRDRVVLFGGLRAGDVLADLWEWNGAVGSWERRSPDALPGSSASTASWPSARRDHAMAYDPTRARGLLVDGAWSDGAEHFDNDAWEWDGAAGQFIPVTPSPLPALWPFPRETAALAFDAGRGRLALYGGRNGFENVPFTEVLRSPVWEVLPAGAGSGGAGGASNTRAHSGTGADPNALAPRGCVCSLETIPAPEDSLVSTFPLLALVWIRRRARPRRSPGSRIGSWERPPQSDRPGG